MSGIEVDGDIPGFFNEMKLRATNKWAMFKIENKKKVILDITGDPCKTQDKEADKAQFEAMKNKLTKEPRYILYDFGFTMKDGRQIKKIAFIFWWVISCSIGSVNWLTVLLICRCPDDSKIGDKMIYASTKDTIKKSFAGLSLEFQANDQGDFDYNEFSDEVERKG